MKTWLKAIAVAGACSLAIAGCTKDKSGTASGSTTTTAGEMGAKKDSIKVGFIYVGPVGDAGWTKKHDDGRKSMEAGLKKELGDDKVTVDVQESVLEADSKPVIEKMARDGYDLIFATSFGYGDPIAEIASKYPKTVFMHATGYKTADNVGTYFGAAEEARYLSGIAAGKASKSGKLGYVAAFPIPEVLRGINAFTLGVRSVNPKATVQVTWTSTWFDPDKESAAAKSLLDAGVDVIAQHQDTQAPGVAAQAAGAKWVGYNDDMMSFAPDAWLTGPVWDWGPFYLKTAMQVVDGSWKSEQYYGNMADGLVGLAPFGKSVDAETQKMIEAKAADIKSGKFAPFTGPINDQAGKERVASGKTATLPELLETDYLVEGVLGEIPAGN